MDTMDHISITLVEKSDNKIELGPYYLRMEEKQYGDFFKK
ncbi:hypothetical protein J2Z42_001503 [Clostridium algifaecis]|uniref:Uncharacterized protein n=1 Tax=Clostridium algifaecis TaxID=1472040 RepID=A0ABS4KVD9_9CLOT|nr:hypothetical protein [Clostridium algifaecis]